MKPARRLHAVGRRPFWPRARSSAQSAVDQEIDGLVRLYLRCPSCSAGIPVYSLDPNYRTITCPFCGAVAVRT